MAILRLLTAFLRLPPNNYTPNGRKRNTSDFSRLHGSRLESCERLTDSARKPKTPRRATVLSTSRSTEIPRCAYVREICCRRNCRWALKQWAENLPLDHHFTDTSQDEVSAVGIKKTSPESKVCSFYFVCLFQSLFILFTVLLRILYPS